MEKDSSHRVDGVSGCGLRRRYGQAAAGAGKESGSKTGSGIEGSVADLRKTLPKSEVKDGLLANMTGGTDRWLKENGLMK